MTEEEKLLHEQIDAATEEINKAYWYFTRCTKGKPPILVCPDAYDRRNKAKERLKEIYEAKRVLERQV
jgi:hypothetical protein